MASKRKRLVSADEIETVAENLRRSNPAPLTPSEAEAIVRRSIDQSPGFEAAAPNSGGLAGYARGGQSSDYQIQELSEGRDPNRFSKKRRGRFLRGPDQSVRD